MTIKQAQSARRKGDYSAATFNLFEQAWEDDKTLKTYAALLSFQRDTGQVLSSKQYHHLVTGFLENNQRLKWFEFRLKLQLQNLCLEYEQQSNVHETSPITEGVKAPGIIPIPWQREAVIQIRNKQEVWRKKWLEDLTIKAKQGIAVVGNSAALSGKSKGHCIDGHGAVIRFNQPVTGPNSTLDFGSRTHTRVVAPGYRGPIPPCDWVVISGPDMQYQLRNWTHLIPVFKRGTPIITVPLQHWASLVESLKAPPSAGLLMLEYLISQPSLKSRIQPYGFGYTPNGKQNYHAADSNHPPTSRHKWNEESKIINNWFPSISR